MDNELFPKEIFFEKLKADLFELLSKEEYLPSFVTMTCEELFSMVDKILPAEKAQPFVLYNINIASNNRPCKIRNTKSKEIKEFKFRYCKDTVITDIFEAIEAIEPLIMFRSNVLMYIKLNLPIYSDEYEKIRDGLFKIAKEKGIKVWVEFA